MKTELEITKKAFNELKVQYNILSSKQIANIKKEPSNLSLAISNEHMKTNMVPTPSE